MKKLILLMLLLPISLIGCTDEESSVTVGHTTVYYTTSPTQRQRFWLVICKRSSALPLILTFCSA